MGVVWDVVFDCPSCEQMVRYQTRRGDGDISLENVEEGSSLMEELCSENQLGTCWCEKCGTKIGFVKKTILAPIVFEELPQDPTPEEIARVQEYLARKGEG